ncbi:MAG: dipeptide epimerase [Sandaracinaceae bacterium]|nr:dipeptide epimerase [Sandaracinaceae bacterium]
MTVRRFPFRLPAIVWELETRPLRVPLIEPFVIATGRMETTDAIEVALTIQQGGERYTGLGECATLPPVTHESPDEIRASIGALSLGGEAPPNAPDALADRLSSLGPVARAGVETAWLDAIARAQGESLAELLRKELAPGQELAFVHESDVTLPIASAEHMGELARGWTARGFRSLKIKVGRALADDVAAIEAIVRAAPTARLRLDANAALTASEALTLLDRARSIGASIELFEQPCRTEDLAGMAEVVARGAVPVVADESCKTLEDVDRLVEARAATGVNLKLVKNGGPLASFAIGQRARACGLTIMAGAMVETRLGLSAMLHVVSALGGVEHVDLDTALLLADDPYVGGYEEALPRLTLRAAAGLGVERRP